MVAKLAAVTPPTASEKVALNSTGEASVRALCPLSGARRLTTGAFVSATQSRVCQAGSCCRVLGQSAANVPAKTDAVRADACSALPARSTAVAGAATARATQPEEEKGTLTE